MTERGFFLPVPESSLVDRGPGTLLASMELGAPSPIEPVPFRNAYCERPSARRAEHPERKRRRLGGG
jgi:hypothetical protein